MKNTPSFLRPLLLTAALGSAFAQAAGVTIGGTDSGEQAAGFTALFAGDRFENFRHMERFVPTSVMPPSSNPWRLGAADNSLSYSGDFLGEDTSLEDFIELSDTSALLVIKDGKVIYEQYRHGDSVDSLHTSFSVAKSFTSALLGIALAEGKIDSLDDPIRKYLPQLDSPTFDNVTIKHVLQMSSGVRFDETYTDPESDINRMTTLVPPMTYLEYINTLDREHPPGTYNHYASINTQLLGILLVRVTGESLTEYMNSRLWQPLGMENRGLWTLDGEGQELAMGGLAASARDYAKLGLLYLNDGKRGDQRILPEGWVQASVTPNEPHLMPGENPASSSVSGYQYQWWTPRNWDGDYLARGIWGQNIYVHPGNRVVIVKLAADQKNFDPRYKLAYIDYLQDIAQSLGAD
ncbi:serine hydrolase domain-containing protein [Parahaliea aestuarii]|uniref:Beta-lactamase family protein n=1 Tax=Parahaliea aestuarii TaxID=1852021 RepID=A0A5C9A0P1_9GAMM|nr:serine hydrolase [Parahaliea aestuarii]TXS93452.1 beta-lactamase family protein [Parahaliea aestuarii]